MDKSTTLPTNEGIKMNRKQELESMSDFEIEQIMYHLINNQSELIHTDILNYCSNPSDIMPIAFDNKICLMFNDDSSEWVAYLPNLEVVIDGNPLRAICIVFILITEE